nr:MAG TPA: hypothetical protein [Caudoviricetes sp.]
MQFWVKENHRRLLFGGLIFFKLDRTCAMQLFSILTVQLHFMFCQCNTISDKNIVVPEFELAINLFRRNNQHSITSTSSARGV